MSLRLKNLLKVQIRNYANLMAKIQKTHQGWSAQRLRQLLTDLGLDQRILARIGEQNAHLWVVVQQMVQQRPQLLKVVGAMGHRGGAANVPAVRLQPDPVVDCKNYSPIYVIKWVNGASNNSHNVIF